MRPVGANQAAKKHEAPVVADRGPGFTREGALFRLHFVRLHALLALHDLEGDLLAFLQGLEAGALDGTEVDKHVLAAFRGDEAKALLSTLDGAGVEIGEPADRVVIVNGKPKASDLPVVKAFDNNDLETLDLSVGNIEKAYGAFRQEQLEKLAYDNLQKSFANRFKNEVSNRENILSKSQYDAQAEIASMKQEFTQLRKSLTAEKETILKAQQESVVTLPSMDELAEMNWSDIHKMVGGV